MTGGRGIKDFQGMLYMALLTTVSFYLPTIQFEEESEGGREVEGVTNMYSLWHSTQSFDFHVSIGALQWW